MNWATERARAVLNSVGYRENPEAAIAAELQAVAEECAEEVGGGMHAYEGCYCGRCAATVDAVIAIRARFPKEEV